MSNDDVEINVEADERSIGRVLSARLTLRHHFKETLVLVLQLMEAGLPKREIDVARGSDLASVSPPPTSIIQSVLIARERLQSVASLEQRLGLDRFMGNEVG